MDDKSTPIASLNNKGDDTEVVNNILSKYNNLQDGQTSIPPLNNNIPQMEKQFENRNLNQEIFQHSSNNVAYEKHYDNEVKRVSNQGKQNNYQDDDQDSIYEDDEEYEVIEKSPDEEYEFIESPRSQTSAKTIEKLDGAKVIKER